MARASRKRAASPTTETMVLPYGCAEAGAPERKIESVETPPVPPYRAWAANLPSTPFGTWLLGQDRHDGWIGVLAKGCKGDPRFPKAGDPDSVRKRLTETGAEADMFEAVDDAELEWLSY